jgi:site-specific DNA-methyltransferase (adenine-specific)
MKTYGTLDIRNCDCMDLMREFPDKHFDLAIVDPPYGIGVTHQSPTPSKRLKSRLSPGGGALRNRIINTADTSWDDNPPTPEYFAELKRVSRNQIIWGGNYFPLPPSRCFVCWDKEQPWPNFSACEMAWTSFDMPAKLFRWNNQAIGNPGKIHPTQKPVELYRWLLSTFAKPEQRILDTHMGSGGIAVACHYFGADLTACELDRGYYEGALERIKRETAQEEFL